MYPSGVIYTFLFVQSIKILFSNKPLHLLTLYIIKLILHFMYIPYINAIINKPCKLSDLHLGGYKVIILASDIKLNPVFIYI